MLSHWNWTVHRDFLAGDDDGVAFYVEVKLVLDSYGGILMVAVDDLFGVVLVWLLVIVLLHLMNLVVLVLFGFRSLWQRYFENSYLYQSLSLAVVSLELTQHLVGNHRQTVHFLSDGQLSQDSEELAPVESMASAMASYEMLIE